MTSPFHYEQSKIVKWAFEQSEVQTTLNRPAKNISWNLIFTPGLRGVRNDSILAVVELEVAAKRSTGGGDSELPLPFNCQLKSQGLFRYDRTMDEDPAAESRRLYNLLRVNGAAYLYAQMRPLIRTLLLEAGVGEVLLPPVNTHTAFPEPEQLPEGWVEAFEIPSATQ